eukprot:scaffold5845_cov142-Skeletonema_marinoi.AAC.4
MAMSPLMTSSPSLRRMDCSKRIGTFRGMVKQICAKPSVDCKREKAVKYFDNNFSIGYKTLGKLVIWEDEEVVDVLYNIRMHYNMTAFDQRVSFDDICKCPEVPCNRFKAIVYKKTQITKLDYEKFGNETCKRQFVGVKHLSSFSDLPFGDKISKMLKGDTAVSMMEQRPFTCIATGCSSNLHHCHCIDPASSPSRAGCLCG